MFILIPINEKSSYPNPIQVYLLHQAVLGQMTIKFISHLQFVCRWMNVIEIKGHHFYYGK